MALKKNLLFGFVYLFFLYGLYSCASLGSPQGGPVDEAPPRFLTSTPLPDETNFSGKRVEIFFDELINLEKASEKVIITPPQKQLPQITALGKKVRVEFADTLIPNTTYTIDFMDAIVDNNEKNALENFTFAFSTGESVDSLIISGLLLNAENLEPMPGILIGLHSDLSDSIFYEDPFLRTTKTNERGRFWIRNIAHGSYHIFALNDKNRDYRFDQPGEEIAFLDSTLIPSFEPAIRFDTLWVDTITIDTVLEIPYTRFTPDSLTLFLFKEEFERQYLMKSERAAPYKISLFFNAKVIEPPRLRLLNKETDRDWFIPEWADGERTLHYWLRDSAVYQTDTLKLETIYMISDSLNRLVETTDTLTLFERRAGNQKKNSKKEQIEFLNIGLSSQAAMDVYDTVRITFSEPLAAFDPAWIRTERKEDTTWVPVSFEFVQDTLNPLTFYINQTWDYLSEYRIQIDSGTFTSIYDKHNNSIESTFKFRGEEDYGHLFVIVSGIEGPGFGELLDASDKPVKKAPVDRGELAFLDIKPGKYYLRYIRDDNNNGKWDTGNYEEKRQPEQVYYYPYSFEIRQNWELEQNWNVTELPVEKQKPLDITKNKPAEKKRKTTDNANTRQSTTGQPSTRQSTSGQSTTGQPSTRPSTR